MKNLKIAVKLILGFSIVSIVMAVVGVFGIVNLKSIDTEYSNMYTAQASPLPVMASVLEYAQRMRVEMRTVILHTGDAAGLQSATDTLNDAISKFEGYTAQYDPLITNPDARTLFDDAMQRYNNAFKPALRQIMDGAAAGHSQADLMAIMTSVTTDINTMCSDFTECMNIKVRVGNEASDVLTNQSNFTIVIMIVIVVLGVAAAMVLGLYISNIISSPVKRMRQLADQVGRTGDLTIAPSLNSLLEKDAQYKDEVGETVGALKSLVSHITNISEELTQIADGDLSRNITSLSDRDVLGVSLGKTLDNLNKMFSEINNASNQVSTGSVQIADGAQLLAQGATEQSATVEELSASVTEVSTQTKVNASMAVDAKTLGEEIKKNAEKGNAQMNQMMQAVREISEASQNISKVIKIIDDIAFQTNILALNAAVEAARAGQHGKGFAVVADEVRSLAAKSAEAAKNTGGLIASAVEKAELGAQISQETSESLRQIVDGIIKSSDLVSQISSSSEEQANAINQISVGIDQVSQVIQQNSATAEESAAASEEMSGQATLLQQLISQFKLRGSSSYGGRMTGKTASPSRVSAPVSVSPQSTGYSISGDKY